MTDSDGNAWLEHDDSSCDWQKVYEFVDGVDLAEQLESAHQTIQVHRQLRHAGYA